MSSDSAAQQHPTSAANDYVSTDAGSELSDSALLEEALQQALDAYKAGLLAAPFGVDEVALKRARRRALRADIRRALGEQHRDSEA